MKPITIFQLGILLLGLCAPALAGAQSARLLRPVTTVETADATWKLIGGRVFAKRSGDGWTVFGYQGEVLVSERGPQGRVGSYLYDRYGRLDRIAYSDGHLVTARYDGDGVLSELKNSATRKLVRFVGKPAADGADPRNAASLTFQRAAASMDSTEEKCPDVDAEDDCHIVTIVGHAEGGGGGGGSGGGAFYPNGNGFGGHAAGGGNGPTPARQPPAECIAEICDTANTGLLKLCDLQRSPSGRAACTAVAKEFHYKCRVSCTSDDWSWLDDWVFGPY